MSSCKEYSGSYFCSPSLVGWDGYSHQEQKKFYQDFANTQKTSTFGDLRIAKIDNQICALDDSKKEAAYVLKYIKEKNNFKIDGKSEFLEYVTQIAVFRDDLNPSVQVVAAHIFWEHLFPMTGLIVTDAEQTKDGKKFWGNRVGEAFAQGLKVGIWDLNHKTVKWFTSVDDYRSQIEKYYKDSDASFKAYRVIIK